MNAKVRVGSMVHFLRESGTGTRCGFEGVVGTLAPWTFDDKTDDPVNCMACLVGHRPKHIIEAESMGACIADAFAAKLAQWDKAKK